MISLPLVVLLCGLAAALIAFALSASRRIETDTVDPAAAEKAVRRSIWRHPRVARFLRQRMDRKSAGGFLLTISFIIIFVVAIVFGLLLAMINRNSWLGHADTSIAEWGARHGHSQAVKILKWVTQLGSTIVVILVLLAVATADFVRRRSREVFVFVAAVGVGELLLNNALKLIIRRDRPNVLHLVVAHGYSFPSGHTTAAAAAWSAAALVLGRDRPRVVRAMLAAGAALIAVSVATSRALLGVHFLSDVIGGLFLGWGWFMLVAIIFGGRAQRLGDPVSDHPQGAAASAASKVPTGASR